MVNASTSTSPQSHDDWVMRSSRDYSYDELADIFNATRVDYIVPMPMNGRRMKEYVLDYDVDLRSSQIVTDKDGAPAGMGMIAFRGRRAWLTRLGVVPHMRQHKLGHKLMTSLVQRAYAHGCHHIQLEVILGNDPAKRLFIKHNFDSLRELAVLNRPPAPRDLQEGTMLNVTALNGDGVVACLAEKRVVQPSWLDDSPSLAKSQDVAGFKAAHPDGSHGWVVFRKSRFQLSHFALNVPTAHASTMLKAIFDTIHRTYPSLDSKLENFPVDAPGLDALKEIGYIEVFRRIEMHRDLT
jgi:ribosomal protein S18 acetylase RimI-like enzyme